MRFVLFLLLVVTLLIPDADARRRRRAPPPPSPPAGYEVISYATPLTALDEYVANGGPFEVGRIGTCTFRKIPIAFDEQGAPTEYLRVFYEPCRFGPQAYRHPAAPFGRTTTVLPAEAERLIRERMAVSVAAAQ